MPATKIMIIRHAERPPDDGLIHGVNMSGTKDPEELTVRGWQRAGALVRFFAPANGHFVNAQLATLTPSSRLRWRIIAPVCGLSTQ